MDYHLSIAGERSGPHTQLNLIEGIREGRLKGDELVWHVGMQDWQPLRSVREFDDYWPVSEETRLLAEAARTRARAELDRPRPWIRFWARVLDYTWFMLALGFVLGPQLPSDPKVIMASPVLRNIPWSSLMLLLYVPVEAWLLSRYGATPGRFLLRTQIRRLDGGLPSFRQALRRSLQVFLKGLALMLLFPFPQVFTALWSRSVLVQRGISPWDETNETRVEHGEPEPWRYLVVTGIVVGIAVTFLLVVAQLAAAMSSLPN